MTQELSNETPASAQDNASSSASDVPLHQQALALLEGRPIVLIGMMGAGKTTVGRRLAAKLGRKFLDSDAEIEEAAGMSVSEIFNERGEPEFRSGETRVISRILKEENILLGTGGGAFMSKETRNMIKETAVSIWLNAEFELLFSRVSRRSNRPLLLTPNPRATLKKLIDERSPIYAKADITVMSTDVPHDAVAEQIIAQLHAYLIAEKQTTQDNA